MSAKPIASCPSAIAAVDVTTERLGIDLRAVAGWTLVSRITGFGRTAVMAAVLGPTYFGNLFVVTWGLPTLIQEVVLGSMVSALLVPALIGRLDAGEPLAAARLANGLLGALLILAVVVVAVILASGGLLLDVLTLSVDDPVVRNHQQQLGWLLLVIFMPQILLQVLIAVAIAVQNARHHFALPAAAPAIENIATISVLLISAWTFGVGTEAHNVTIGQLLLLGLGLTAAVGIHAAVQWWGACRSGIRLLPTIAWREQHIRQLFRMAAPSSGNTLLSAAGWFGLQVAAGAVPGGVVALQIANNFFQLPIALAARPVATAMMPRLSRSTLSPDGKTFLKGYKNSVELISFVALPASLTFLLMPQTLAHVVSFGEMSTGAGFALVSVAIIGLGVGLLGEAVMVIGVSALYARRNAMVPLQAMVIRTAILAVGIAWVSSTMHGTTQLLALCLAMSAANLVAAAYLHLRLIDQRPLAFVTSCRVPWVDLAISVLTVLPATAVAGYLTPRITSQRGQFALAVVTLGLVSVIYLLMQWLRGAAAFNTLLERSTGPTSPSEPLSAPDSVTPSDPTGRLPC